MAAKTILVIDSEDMSSLLAFVLGEEGYEVTTASYLEEAIDVLSGRRFDLIITDALEQGRRLDLEPSFLYKLKAAAGETPIILLSTYAEEWMAREHGLADSIPKPFDLVDLVRRVKKVLG